MADNNKGYVRFHETLTAPDPDSPAPASVRKSIKRDGIQYLCGTGAKPAKVMFLTPHPEEEEVDDTRGSPAPMKGSSGALMRRLLLRVGMSENDYYFSTVLKWCPPRGYKISVRDVDRMAPALEKEIKEVQPDVIVCMGKLPFQFLFKRNISLKKVLGGWFYSDHYGVRLYVTNEPWILLRKPEYFDKFLVDFKEVRETVWNLTGNDTNPRDIDITVVHNMDELRELTRTIHRELPAGYLGVDMESGGPQIPPDGFMRSLQVAWTQNKGAYIRFYDDACNYVFDAPMDEVAKEIAKWYSSPKYRLVGHQLSTDLTWVYFHLGLDFYGRGGWDTLYAEHCIDEASDLKLERLSVKYTNLGRYDMELLLYKESVTMKEDEGYARIPDKILIPYAVKDVVCLLRIMPQQMQKLAEEKTYQYYTELNLPFVTDVFTEMTTAGLPVNVEYLENLRMSFHAVQEFLDRKLSNLIFRDTLNIIFRTMTMQNPEEAYKHYTPLTSIAEEKDWETFEERLREFAGREWSKYVAAYKQLREAEEFNIRSSDQLRHWLFKVKKFTPLKTTKKEGFSMPWEKVMELPENRRAAYNPAVDKNTLKVFAAEDKLVDFILQLNGVGNITKGFLKNADKDTGKEQGVAKWVSKQDVALHTNFALTETGRCRTWNPNILNYNKVVSDFVERGFKQYNEAVKAGEEPGEELKSTGVRTIVQARPGWCMVDSDWATAEVVALAYVSGDQDMIKTLTEPDRNFALKQTDKGPIPVRVSFDYDSPVPEHGRDIAILHSPDDTELLRQGDKLLRPKRDIHWEVAEMVNKAPRENLDKDIHRQSAKITNFCIAEGELVTTRRGLVPVEKVSKDDLLWDGWEWVKHEGLVYAGKKEIIEYQGLRATPLHEVWTEELGKVHLGVAASRQLTLICGATDSGNVVMFGDLKLSRDKNLNLGRTKNVKTYDILNAGPRNRFTCSGVIVSNSCPYGASGTSIEYQIEVLTGKKPEPGTGDALLDGRAKRYPVADMFLIGQEFIPFDPGYYRSVSGRLRHFHYSVVENVDGISEWAKKGILSPLIRQARNFPIQEIVGASMMRAQIALLAAVRENNMRARNPISLYDALLSHCPMGERWAIWNLHHHCMSYGIQWETPGGLLKFDIDPEMCLRWGSKNTKEEQELLDGEEGKDHPVALAFPLKNSLQAI